jgi:hypothetical protein
LVVAILEQIDAAAAADNGAADAVGATVSGR